MNSSSGGINNVELSSFKREICDSGDVASAAGQVFALFFINKKI
jgi:hypothetical protein